MGISAKVIPLNKSLNGEKTMTPGMKTDTPAEIALSLLALAGPMNVSSPNRKLLLEASDALLELAGDNTHLRAQNAVLQARLDPPQSPGVLYGRPEDWD
jgi:hypothetical protein